jgi:hypothetical protein
LNLLVCRIQRNIDRDRSLQLFLRMIRPKLTKLANQIHAASNAYGSVFIDDLVAEAEAVVSDVLINHYAIGEIGHPLHYLFGQPNGSLYRWAITWAKQHRAHYSRNVFYGSTAGFRHTQKGEGGDSVKDFESGLNWLNSAITHGKVRHAPIEVSEHPSEVEVLPLSDSVKDAAGLVDDGVTLSLQEYRVMRFCLNHARDDGIVRLMDGLHKHIGVEMDAYRQHVSRLFATAERRVIDALGLTSHVLAERGVDVEKVPRYRRKNIRRVRGWRPQLTVQEIIDAVAFYDSHPKARLADVAWAYGVGAETLRSVCRRFRGKSEEEIRATLLTRAKRNQ